MTLLDFLYARYDEESRDALWAVRHGDWDLAEWASGQDADHGQHWRPTRVLVETAAKRRIAGQLWLQVGIPNPASTDPSGTEALWILKMMALAYADHPDYEESWAV